MYGYSKSGKPASAQERQPSMPMVCALATMLSCGRLRAAKGTGSCTTPFFVEAHSAASPSQLDNVDLDHPKSVKEHAVEIGVEVLFVQVYLSSVNRVEGVLSLAQLHCNAHESTSKSHASVIPLSDESFPASISPELSYCSSARARYIEGRSARDGKAEENLLQKWQLHACIHPSKSDLRAQRSFSTSEPRKKKRMWSQSTTSMPRRLVE